MDRRLEQLEEQASRLGARLERAEERTKGTGPLAARVLPSVFSLEVPDGSGAGFAAWRAGGTTVLLTAAHVVSGWDEVTVRRAGRSWRGSVLEVDEVNDLATVAVPGAIARPLWQAPVTALPSTGATLVLFGSPLGYEGTVTRGIISRVAYNEIQTDAPANPGSSGGPALTEDGRLVGVVVSGYEGRDINFVVPVRRVCVTLRAC
ncbi:MAG TPA: S1C family serine protease [Gaiellaceae bacterium]|nr:S1C family serine protease [Gaiellaceae bacterium]